MYAYVLGFTDMYENVRECINGRYHLQAGQNGATLFGNPEELRTNHGRTKTVFEIIRVIPNKHPTSARALLYLSDFPKLKGGRAAGKDTKSNIIQTPIEKARNLFFTQIAFICFKATKTAPGSGERGG